MKSELLLTYWKLDMSVCGVFGLDLVNTLGTLGGNSVYEFEQVECIF